MSGKSQPKDIDERVRRTRNALGSALMALSREKPIDAITVSELTANAGIGRSTFYAHFADLPDFLCSSYAGMLARAAAIGQHADGDRSALATRVILDHLAKSGAHGQVVRRSRTWPMMMAAGQGRLRVIAEENLRRTHPRLSPARRRAAANFIAGGLIAMIQDWTDHDRRDPAGRIQRLFEDFVAGILERERR
jgi:AcrR family transcriptional regulator